RGPVGVYVVETWRRGRHHAGAAEQCLDNLLAVNCQRQSLPDPHIGNRAALGLRQVGTIEGENGSHLRPIENLGATSAQGLGGFDPDYRRVELTLAEHEDGRCLLGYLENLETPEVGSDAGPVLEVDSFELERVAWRAAHETVGPGSDRMVPEMRFAV